MFFRTVAADLRHLAALWHVPPSRRWLYAAIKVALYPRVRAVVWFRLSQVLWRWQLRPLALLVQGHVLRISGAEIHPACTIGPGLCLVHSSGLVIGPRSVLGSDVVIHQGVTLGSRGHDGGEPSIGDRAVLYAGAKVLGPVRVGADAVIGANAVVLTDVPEGAIAIGVPARLVAKHNSAEP